MIRNNGKIDLGWLGLLILMVVCLYVTLQLTAGSGFSMSPLP
ncbi:hypothetical protein [Sphingobacterium griseoflavum]|nr:hypothetical protein [Sphingobacterium griseoflavum]